MFLLLTLGSLLINSYISGVLGVLTVLFVGGYIGFTYPERKKSVGDLNKLPYYIIIKDSH